MPNNFDSNFTRKLMDKVTESFESKRVISKNVDTQTFQGQYTPNTGDTIDIKRPTDHISTRTSNGDLTGVSSDIITGKASATVQDYISILVDYDEADQALKMGNDENRFFDDIAQRIVVDLELDFANFAMKNTGLLSGTPGNGVNSWSEIAQSGALLQSTGAPMNKKWNYALNPYSQVAIANEQRSLGVNPEAGSALANATISENFAGMRVMTATTLGSFTSGTGATRSGTLSANPDVTYATHKDTMKQSLAVTGFQANLPVKAGDVIEITPVKRLNLSTRQPVLDETGAQVTFSGTVVADVTLNGSGAGTLVISGPAIYEASGAYNTVDAAPVSGNAVVLKSASATTYQPNLFWHPDAFSIASVPINKLHSTDTLWKSNDGLIMRCSKFSDGIKNQQTVRFDLRPAYGVLNPFLSGQAFGNP